MKIYQLKNGKFSATIYLGNKKTKRVTADTKDELKKEIHKIKAGIISQKHPTSITLADAFREYIDVHRSIFSPSTIKGYETIIRCSFKTIQNLPLSEITENILQAEISSMASNLSFKTLSNRCSLFIQSIVKYIPEAKNWDIKLPQKKKASIHVPTKEEIDALIKYAHERYPEYELPLMLGAYCGLRRGEICALTYDDINADSVTISKSVVLTSSGDYVIKSPKTYAGFRSVPLSPSILALIRQRRKNGLKLISVTTEQITDRFPNILKGAGVPKMRFHDLRHFFASTLVTLGIPDIYAIRLTGHSTTAMLQRVYQHTFKDAEETYKKRLISAF